MHVERVGSVLFCAACSFAAANHSLDNSQCRLLTKWRTAWSSLIHKWRDELTCIKSEKSSRIYTSMLGQGWRVYACWGVTHHLHFWQNDNVEYTPPWILQLSWSLQWRERAGMISMRVMGQDSFASPAVTWAMSLVCAKHCGRPQQHCHHDASGVAMVSLKCVVALSRLTHWACVPHFTHSCQYSAEIAQFYRSFSLFTLQDQYLLRYGLSTMFRALTETSLCFLVCCFTCG